MLYLKTETRAWLLRTSFYFVVPRVSGGSNFARSHVRAGLTNYARFSGVKLSNSPGEYPDPHYRACGLLVAGYWQTGRKRSRPEAMRRADRDNLLPSMRLDSRQACSRRSDTVIWNCATVLSLPFRIRGAIESDSRDFYMRQLLIINTLSMLELIPWYS